MDNYNCIAVFSIDKSKILLCKRAKMPYKGLYNFPGGKREPGETSEKAAYRELYEETGISDIRLEHLMDFTYYHKNLTLELYGGCLSYEPMLKEEINPLRWFDVHEDFCDITRFAGDRNMGHIIRLMCDYFGIFKI